MKFLFTIITLFLTVVNAVNHIELNTRSSISLRGPINSVTTNNLIEKLTLYDEKVLNLFINSPGGSVMDGMKIVDQLNTMKVQGITVNCIADFSASMAFIILQACENRFALNSAILMQHQMFLGLQGNIYNLESYFNFIKSIRNELEEMQAKRIGMEKNAFINKVMNDWWLSGNEAKKNNAGDDVIIVSCHDDLINSEEFLNIQTMFGDVTIVYSGCPLLRTPKKVIWKNITPEHLEEIVNSYLPENYINNLSKLPLIP